MVTNYLAHYMIEVNVNIVLQAVLCDTVTEIVDKIVIYYALVLQL